MGTTFTYHFNASSSEYASLGTAGLRKSFLLEQLFVPGRVTLTATEPDRAVVGAAIPLAEPLRLEAPPELRCRFFLEQREMGVINLGGAGAVTAGGVRHEMATEDLLYIGRGVEGVVFESTDAAKPARFYLVSYPAHTAYPTTLVRPDQANQLELGMVEKGNRRRIRQYVHPKGVRSCQLVMGVTRLQPGSCWNTMPPHTHMRRSEVYLYFDLPATARVAHFMGRPDETRVLWVGAEQAVISPPWSIHSGAGTEAYAFVWAMGGENQTFDDMDPAPVETLR